MLRFNTSIVLPLSTLLLVSVTSAQQTATTAVPSLIRYSGTLKDAQGAVVSSSTAVGVMFAIYKQEDGGAPVWQETQNVTPDANGQYSVVLGSTTATGLPDDLFSQQEQRWLGVYVQGQAEQPRVLLVSVPYAFKAHEAETLGGLPPSAFVKAETVDASNGTSGSASSAAGNAASTTAPAKSRKPPDGPCPGGADPSLLYIPVFLDPMTLCDSVIYQDSLPGGNIGIGTVTPGSKLDVNGDVNTSQVYKIHGTTVLSIFGLPIVPVPPSSPSFSVFVGPGAGRSRSIFSIGLNTFVGGNAGFSTTTGGGNTFLGASAGANNTTGLFNTFLGDSAGVHSTTSSDNTFVGFEAGYRNTLADTGAFFGYQAGFSNSCINGLQFCGDRNIFFGNQAGYSNTIGFDNAFSGYRAGYSNTTGDSNTFYGSLAGYANTAGSGNTFFGGSAGSQNNCNSDGICGEDNTFIGTGAGGFNTVGSDNTFVGTEAGSSNNCNSDGVCGENNTFTGAMAGSNNITGNGNTFSGASAGLGNHAGSNNIFIGQNAGVNNLDTNDNIYIGSSGATFREGATIRIGEFGVQQYVYIQGIYGASTFNGTQVFVDNTGQLGTIRSSARFKEQVRDMGDSTSALMKLRPVTFLYKPEYTKGERTLQYGLIAEEVANVYPELVAYDDDGQPYTVRYHYITTMLLNEVQKQYHRAEAEAKVIGAQEQKIGELEQRLSRLESLVTTQVKASATEKPTQGQPPANGGLQ